MLVKITDVHHSTLKNQQVTSAKLLETEIATETENDVTKIAGKISMLVSI